MFEGNIDSFAKLLHSALRAWHKPGGTPDNLLAFLLLVLDRRAALRAEASPALLRLSTNEVLLVGIDELAVQDDQAATVLKLRFAANKSLLMVANQLVLSDHSISRLQRAAIYRLAEIIWSREQSLRKSRIQEIEAYLPPATYSQLFGIDEASTNLGTYLLQNQKPWVIAVVGMGGLGKTALADYTVRHIIRQFYFEDVIWLHVSPQGMNGRSSSPQFTFDNLIVDLSAHFWPERPTAVSPNQRLVEIRQRLKSRPYLIVIDNLESEKDTAYLLTHLHDAANPSKFLLTTRTRPTDHALAFHYPINELSLADAMDLLRHHAADFGIEAMETATIKDMKEIYDVVGGNPLALKLVVSLLDVLPLNQVLRNLSQSHVGQIDELYRHIYWQAWQLLSTNAQKILLAMPLVSESGGTAKYLSNLCGLGENELWPAILELRNRSLVEIKGSLQEKRYAIHRLTETFLQTTINHWPQGGEEDDSN